MVKYAHQKELLDGGGYMSKKKIGILIGVVVAIAALGGTGFYFRDEIKGMIPFAQSANSADRVFVEKVSKVMNQYTGNSGRYNGIVETQAVTEINVDSSRTISEIKVEEGDMVEVDQVLVTYDTSDLKLQIQQANLEVESINNDIDNYNKQIATLTAERDKAQESDKFSYTTQIQTLENSIAQKKFDLESKQLEISKYKTQKENSSVKSKVAGVVQEINEKGIDANGNTAPFMKILQEGEYRVKGSIDEQNIWMLSEGQSVLVRSRIDETQTWNGTVSVIDKENPQQNGSNNGYAMMGNDSGMTQTTKYPFYIELASADGLILGQHVYIEMDQGQEEKKEGLWLYGSYIVQDDGEPYVWAATEKERLEKRYVKLGEYDESLDEYEILSGLTPNDYVTWPMPGLYEGVTTVTSQEEVDYSAPLYNQESTEMMDGGMMMDDGMMTDDGMMMDDGMTDDGMMMEGTEMMFPEEGTEMSGEGFTDSAAAEPEVVQ